MSIVIYLQVTQARKTQYELPEVSPNDGRVCQCVTDQTVVAYLGYFDGDLGGLLPR